MMKKIVHIILVLLCTSTLYAQEYGTFQAKEFVVEGDTLPYQILYPKNYDTSKKYPLVLFLHGAGERGIDNQKQLVHGSTLFLEEQNQTNYPAIVVFPQCSRKSMWTNTRRFKKSDRAVFEFSVVGNPPRSAQLVNLLIDQLLDQKIVDEKKLYIMGLSMGGMATLDHLYRYPNKYAAGIVICGAHNPDLARYYAQTPIWFLHGAKDDVVPPYYTQQIYKTIKKEHRKTRYTLFKNANHNAWDPSFAEPKLLEWLFQF